MKSGQSVCLDNLRQSIGQVDIESIPNNFSTPSIDLDEDKDDVDGLALQVLKELENANDSAAPAQGTKDSCGSSAKSTIFWAYFLAIPVIFIHAVATRMQFIYGALYGRDGLHLSNAAAILAIGFTCAGRATAPPLLVRHFKAPHLFMLLNTTTLVGCLGMLLIPVIGGTENFDKNGALKEGLSTPGLGTAIFYYLVMYIQGLTEVLTGWDILMKFETKEWTPDEQQNVFRTSFVTIALGSAAAFYLSSWLYEMHGLYGCAYLGIATGVLNVIFPALYLIKRWREFIDWRNHDNKECLRLARKSSSFMKILHLDGLGSKDEEDDNDKVLRDWMRSSFRNLSKTKKLKFVESSSAVAIDDDPKTNRTFVHYREPRNHFEYKEQLQHQASERILKNFRRLVSGDCSNMFPDGCKDLVQDEVLRIFDPTVLLAHSKYIEWPSRFKKEIKVVRWFCILALGLGATMISAQFAVYTLYLVDVWNVTPIYAGTSMAVGEIAGMFTLLTSILLRKMKGDAKKGQTTAQASKSDSIIGSRSLFRYPFLLLHVPSEFVVCCALAAIPLALMGFLKTPTNIDDIVISGISSYPPGLIVILLSGVFIGIINCVMHSTTIEMSSRLLLDDLFGSSVALGYSIRRIVNLSVCLLATWLYSLSEYAVYQAVALFYALSVPVSFYVLASYLKCMPWQEREVILDEEPKKDIKCSRFSILDITQKSASRNEIDWSLGEGSDDTQ